MAYLMNISFDNTSRLCRDIWYFDYKGIQFKLIQNNSPKYADVLLTIANDRKTSITEEKAYQMAAEYLSALSWENNSKIKIGDVGGPGRPDGFSLRKAECQSFGFHKIPHFGGDNGRNIMTIPFIESDQHRIALSLFREAFGSPELFLSFLLYWQILEINKTPVEAKEWIDQVYTDSRQKLYIDNDQLKFLEQGVKSLGQCLYDDFRNAIAHIKRESPAQRSIKLDTLEESRRMHVGVRTIEKFVRYYIAKELRLSKKLYLVRVNKGFPTYVEMHGMMAKHCEMAYKLPSWNQIISKKPKNRAIFRTRKEKIMN